MALAALQFYGSYADEFVREFGLMDWLIDGLELSGNAKRYFVDMLILIHRVKTGGLIKVEG